MPSQITYATLWVLVCTHCLSLSSFFRFKDLVLVYRNNILYIYIYIYIYIKYNFSILLLKSTFSLIIFYFLFEKKSLYDLGGTYVHTYLWVLIKKHTINLILEIKHVLENKNHGNFVKWPSWFYLLFIKSFVVFKLISIKRHNV